MFISNTTIKKLNTTELAMLGAAKMGLQFLATKKDFKKRILGFKLILNTETEVHYERVYEDGSQGPVRCEFIKPDDHRFTGIWVYREYDIRNNMYLTDKIYHYTLFLKA